MGNISTTGFGDSDPLSETEPTYNAILQSEFESRARRNPRYSLRAFSRDAGVSASRLSEILRGKQGLSVGSAARIAERLRFEPQKAEVFVALVELQHSRSLIRKEVAREKIGELLGRQEFPLRVRNLLPLIGWEDLAIVNLALTRDFDPSPVAIAARLAISREVVERSLNRLVQLRILQPVAEGLMVSGSLRELAARKGERFERATSPPPRALSPAGTSGADLLLWLPLAIRARDFEEAEAMIRRFERDFVRRFSVRHADSVFLLLLRLFRLDQEVGSWP